MSQDLLTGANRSLHVVRFSEAQFLALNDVVLSSLSVSLRTACMFCPKVLNLREFANDLVLNRAANGLRHPRAIQTAAYPRTGTFRLRTFCRTWLVYSYLSHSDAVTS